MQGADHPLTAGHWCVLQTSGGRTLPVAASLREAGFEVWTPIKTITRRRVRSKATINIDVPILPTFVFARADRVADLIAISTSTARRHPPFSIFRHAGRVPLIAESEIRGLRAAEKQGRTNQAKKQRHTFAPGTKVQVDDRSFAGLTGVVEAGEGKQALVAFGGNFRIQIDTWLLHEDRVEAAPLWSQSDAA